jgi:ribonucleoside-diphosphate reductase alpha chain
LESDTIEGIEETLTKIAYASKEGAGIGLLIDPLRSKESFVGSFNGNAGGVVRFADMVQGKMRFYKQGSRSGSCALYLSVWHRDIIDFLELTSPVGDEQLRTRDLFTAVVINDLFMRKLEANEDWHTFCPNEIVKAGLRPLYELYGDEFEAEYAKAVELGLGKPISGKRIFDSIIKSQVESGKPYVMYKDNANKRNMQDNIGVIKMSNLCMTGDQRVVTDKGYLTVKELHEKGGELNLFNGETLVKSSEIKLRGVSEDVYKITLDNGLEHKVTSYHGIPVIDDKNRLVKVECKDLKIGDKVAIQTKKGLFGTRNLVKEAYLLGQYQSDGTQYKSSIAFELWENDFDLVDVIEDYVHDLYDKYGYTPRYSNKGGYFVDGHETAGGVKKKRLTTTFFKEFGFTKGGVPNWIWESDEDTHWSYIKGLLEADGTVHLSQSKGQPIQLSYVDVNKDFLKELQLLFNNLGLQSKIYDLHKASERLLPDGKGGKKLYNCKDSYRLVVGGKNSVLEIERNTGFLSRKKIILEDKKYRDNTKKTSKVVSVEYVGKEDVYCPTVYNDEHIFIAQGMKTFNCAEIYEANRPKYSAQCTLASINLSEHNNLDTIAKSTKVLVKALNQVIDKNKWSDDWSEAAGLDQRAIAIGVAGMADFFAKKKISYESDSAKVWNADIFETMYKSALTESMSIAEAKGKTYPAWEGSRYAKGETYIEGWSPKPNGEPIPMYNSLLLALMPTASSAILLGSFESFEPVTANLFTRRVGQGEFLIVNKYLVNELLELDMWNDNMINKIIGNKGSVQNIVEIPEDIRYRYKDVWEISQKTLLDLSIVRNKYVDQSQSLNVYHADAKYSKIASALMYAWKGGLKTGVYYTRTKSKLDANSKLASMNTEALPEKPKDSPFECFGCSA